MSMVVPELRLYGLTLFNTEACVPYLTLPAQSLPPADPYFKEHHAALSALQGLIDGYWVSFIENVRQTSVCRSITTS